MKEKIAIIGSGNVGGALGRGLTKAGYAVQHSTQETVRETAAAGDVVILAVPFPAIDDVVEKLRDVVKGKIVIDVTNALTSEMQWAIGFSTSGAEELQKKLPGARVVKGFNTVFAQHMDSGHVKGVQLTVFAAGDDEAARKTVLRLARDIGFDAVDAGPLERARGLEALGYFNIQLGYVQGMGTDIGFQLEHKAAPSA